MDNILQLRNISKKYSGVPILDRISCTFFPDRIYAITGESGVGKTTLVRILAGLDRSYQGSVTWNGMDLAKSSEEEISWFRRKDLGIQLQNNILISSLSGIDNAALPLLLLERSVDESRAQSALLLQTLDLGESAAKKVEKMSGGEKKRTAIACALIRRPPLVILDEPTGNLDSRHESQILSLLCEYRIREHACIILVTHSHTAVQIADRRLTLVRTREGGQLYEE